MTPLLNSKASESWGSRRSGISGRESAECPEDSESRMPYEKDHSSVWSEEIAGVEMEIWDEFLDVLVAKY